MAADPHGRRTVDELLSDLDRVLKFRAPVRASSPECDPPGRHLPQVHLRDGEPFKVTCKRCAAAWRMTRDDQLGGEKR
jgi:hypothetical protein